MLMTWKLWRMLKNPPRNHPLFIRMSKAQAAPLPRHINIAAMSILVVMICFVTAVIPPLLSVALFLPMLFVVFNGSVYGLVWAARVSRTIVHEHEQRTFEILSIVPDGAFGSSWAICAGCIHRSASFDKLRLFSLEEFALAWVVSLILSAGKWQLYINTFQENALLFPIFVLLIYSLLLVLTFYFNNIHSVIIGVLVGIGMPIYVRSRLDAQVWAVGIYLLIQIVTYLLTWILGGVFLPMVLPTGIASEVLSAFLSLGIFLVIRETVIALLWRGLVFQLNSDTNEIQQSFG
jgi:hypothetical protein